MSFRYTWVSVPPPHSLGPLLPLPLSHLRHRQQAPTLSLTTSTTAVLVVIAVSSNSCSVDCCRFAPPWAWCAPQLAATSPPRHHAAPLCWCRLLPPPALTLTESMVAALVVIVVSSNSCSVDCCHFAPPCVSVQAVPFVLLSPSAPLPRVSPLASAALPDAHPNQIHDGGAGGDSG